MILQAAAFAIAYFAAVFGVGFLLGVGRALWVPDGFERLAERAELPLMIVVSVYVASALVDRLRMVDSRAALAAGLAALALLLAAEFAGAFALRGLTPAAYIASRGPVSGVLYAAALVLFALIPSLIVRRQR